MSCPHRLDAASYVLGALDPADRTDFESHLADCAACAAAVAELSRLPGALAHVDVTEVLSAPPEPPRELLAGALARVRGQRRRRRVRAALTIAATILVAAVGTVTAVELSRSDGPTVTTDGTLTAEFTPMIDAAVWGTAEIIGYPEGTRITVSCSYRAADSGGSDGQKPDGGYLYRLMVTNRFGESDVAGSWHADNGNSHRVTLFSRWEPEDITGLEVQDLEGHAILSWRRETD